MRWFALLIIIVLAVPAWSVVLQGRDTVTISSGQTINDDLVVSGGTVAMQGEVIGDMVVAAGTVDISGPIRGSLFIAGGNITVRQPVAGSIYIAGGNVQLSSTIGRNLLIAGGTVLGEKGMTVGRDLAVTGGNVTVAGSVARNLLGSMGTLALTNTARIGRNVTVMTNDAKIDTGAVIGGSRTITQPQSGEHGRYRGMGFAGWFFWQLLNGIALFIVGAITVALAPKLTAETQAVLRARPWASLLTGLIVLIVVPVAALILIFTLIGIPLALILLVLYWIAIYISPIFLAIMVGRRILRKSQTVNIYVAQLIGIALLVIVRLIPFLGGIVSFLVMLIGLGALVLALQGRSANPLYRIHTE